MKFNFLLWQYPVRRLGRGQELVVLRQLQRERVRGGAGHRVRADRVQQQGDQPSLQPFHLAAVQHSRRMQDGRLGHGQPQGRDAKVYEQNQMVMREPPLSVADRGG